MLTQGYTQQIVDTVHRSIIQDITVLNKQAAQTAGYRGRALVSIGIDEMDEQVALLALG